MRLVRPRSRRRPKILSWLKSITSFRNEHNFGDCCFANAPVLCYQFSVKIYPKLLLILATGMSLSACGLSSASSSHQSEKSLSRQVIKLQQEVARLKESTVQKQVAALQSEYSFLSDEVRSLKKSSVGIGKGRQFNVLSQSYQDGYQVGLQLGKGSPNCVQSNMQVWNNSSDDPLNWVSGCIEGSANA